LSKNKEHKITLSQYLEAGIPIINPALYSDNGLPIPGNGTSYQIHAPMLLLEIPPDIQSIKQADLKLAIQWSDHIREAFSFLFRIGYFATDFIYFPGEPSKSYYVLTDGDATF
jgi:predicted GNAT superfamily acetyltransferase